MGLIIVQTEMRTLKPVNTFSAARFGQLLIVGLRSKEFRIMVMAVAVMFVSTIILNFSIHGVMDSALKNGFNWGSFLDDIQGFSTFCIVVGPTVGASLFAAALKERGDRISHIMLPATNAEKFLARFVVVVVGAVVVSLAIYVAVFLVVAVPAVISGKVAIDDLALFDFSGAVTASGVDGRRRVYSEILLGAGYVYVVSAYMLGGMVWKGRSWLLTTVTLVLLSLLLSLSLNVCIDLNTVFSSNEQELNDKMFCVVLSLIFAALAALNVWGTWRLFSRMQASAKLKLCIWKRIRRSKTSTL